MEIWVDGPRATDESRSAARQAAPSDLPALTDEERMSARRSGWTEHHYARTKYAGELGALEWAKRAQPIGVLLDSFLKERVPEAFLVSLTLKTLRGVYRGVASIQGKEVEFHVREALVDDLLEAGDASCRGGKTVWPEWRKGFRILKCVKL